MLVVALIPFILACLTISLLMSNPKLQASYSYKPTLWPSYNGFFHVNNDRKKVLIMKLEIVNKEVEIGDNLFFLSVIFFDNGISIFISEKSPKLGTIGLSYPPIDFSSSTSLLHGMKNEQFVRIIGERYSKITGKMVLVSLNIENINIFDDILSILNEIIINREKIKE